MPRSIADIEQELETLREDGAKLRIQQNHLSSLLQHDPAAQSSLDILNQLMSNVLISQHDKTVEIKVLKDRGMLLIWYWWFSIFITCACRERYSWISNKAKTFQFTPTHMRVFVDDRDITIVLDQLQKNPSTRRILIRTRMFFQIRLEIVIIFCMDKRKSFLLFSTSSPIFNWIMMLVSARCSIAFSLGRAIQFQDACSTISHSSLWKRVFPTDPNAQWFAKHLYATITGGFGNFESSVDDMVLALFQSLGFNEGNLITV